MKKSLLAILLILALPSLLWGKSSILKLDQSISLVFSSTVHGEVEPCG